jgi:hypothetical protein
MPLQMLFHPDYTGIEGSGKELELTLPQSAFRITSGLFGQTETQYLL